MRPFQRIFGTGPRGLALSLATLAVAWGLSSLLGDPAIHGDGKLGTGLLIVSAVATTAGMIWSLKSLPPGSRGRKLVTHGAFRYVRHPLYAAFLLSFDFGLAFYLDNWIYVLWALGQFPLWHANVVEEERLMHKVFGQAYVAYCERTGRFIPKL